MSINFSMNYEITWKWDEFSKALHFEEATKHIISRPYRIYAFFTDKNAVEKVNNIVGDPIKGIPSKTGGKNVLYVGMVKYQRKEELIKFPMRIGERILFQGHKNLFTMFEYEPGPIYLGIVGINEPYYAENKHISNIEGYLIERLGPRYNLKIEKTIMYEENISIKSIIHNDSQKTLFSDFMEFEDN